MEGPPVRCEGRRRVGVRDDDVRGDGRGRWLAVGRVSNALGHSRERV